MLKPFSYILYAIMFLCDSLLPSFASRGVPSRGSQSQVTAGIDGLYNCCNIVFNTDPYLLPLAGLSLRVRRSYFVVPRKESKNGSNYKYKIQVPAQTSKTFTQHSADECSYELGRSMRSRRHRGPRPLRSPAYDNLVFTRTL